MAQQIGLYVRENFYGTKIAQALARAKHLVRTENRDVQIIRVDERGRWIENIITPAMVKPAPVRVDIVDPLAA